MLNSFSWMPNPLHSTVADYLFGDRKAEIAALLKAEIAALLKNKTITQVQAATLAKAESIEELVALEFELDNINMQLAEPKMPKMGDKVINLAGCGLTRLPESLIERIRAYNPAALNISLNQIFFLPEVFGTLKTLQALWAANNQLRSLPDSFGELNLLEALFLMKNQLSTLPASLNNLQQLKELSVMQNPLVISNSLRSILIKTKNEQLLDTLEPTTQSSELTTIHYPVVPAFVIHTQAEKATPTIPLRERMKELREQRRSKASLVSLT